MSKSHSYSQLSTAYRCGQLYKYLYIDQLKSSALESGEMKFGTAIHLGVEAILTNPNSDYAGLFDLFWNLEKDHNNNKYGRFTWDQLREQGHVLLARFERLHAKNFEVVEMEQRLHGSIGDIKIEGTPDFIGLYKGKKAVVDFKTSGYRYPKEKIKTSEQLHLYSYLAKQDRSFIAEQVVYIVFVKGINPSIQCLSEDIEPARLKRILNNVTQQGIDLEKKIKSNKFTRNYANCIIGENKCSFFDECHIDLKDETDKNE